MEELLNRIRRILDKASISHRLYEPDDESRKPEIIFTMNKDDDCCKDVMVVISVDERFMFLKAFIQGYRIEQSKMSEAITFCNTWNATHYFPQVSVSDDGVVVTSWCNLISSDIPDDYIKNSLILSFTHPTWLFFCDFTKEFLEKNN